METPFIRYVTTSSDFVYRVGKNKVFKGYFIVTGDSPMDITISCILGENADASLHVVNVLSGVSKVSLKTLQHHTAKNARSNVIVKTVLAGNASFSYDGNIKVDKNADKTDAYERNENLMLSENAKAISHPTLEISASDVRCTHGSTTGEIPFEELWYLMTRGLSRKNAETLYIQGFIKSAFALLNQDMSEAIVSRIMDI
jgi:Fe-S cluster assembly protein SufD